ncbi:hypothetical protein QQS21_003027 [Conoideocrella luteorostrata]|uniref:Uncharacterized protein n=1 Tax=Conoideocrella luteorostrata TaxID=1105319 RepID=A0AAJ0CY66_9HYPO|nr:hypothetical protein QQS21_003027 [Conoideocrella luteorostrata]
MKAVMSTQLSIVQEAENDMVNILEEIQEAREAWGANWWRQIPELSILPRPHISPGSPAEDNVFDEIPREDATYRYLSSDLIPHRRHPDMYLLEYQTFSGAMAYQPCSKDIDLRGIFEALQPVELGGDGLFRIARAWSCIIQSIHDLPKDVRWVLATIYNFSNDMMLPKTSKNTMWAMRPWLMHWFHVADLLFKTYDLPLSSPSCDWFLRPESVTVEYDTDTESESQTSFCYISSGSSDGNQTVIRHGPNCSDPDINGIEGRAHTITTVPQIISSWIAAQPDWADILHNQTFDPTPGGRVDSRTESASPPNSISDQDIPVRDMNSFGLNPEATEFDPYINITTSAASVTSRSPSCLSMKSSQSTESAESTEYTESMDSSIECDSCSELDGVA